ncbi:MAG: hypothetical protein ACLR6J_07880 [Parabacteroides merdae]
MNYTYMKGCALCMTLCLTSAALPGRANAESSAIVNEVLQSSVVKGVVKDSNGEPLLGVNVLVKGTTIGAVTDIEAETFLLKLLPVVHWLSLTLDLNRRK